MSYQKNDVSVSRKQLSFKIIAQTVGSILAILLCLVVAFLTSLTPVDPSVTKEQGDSVHVEIHSASCAETEKINE